MADFVLELLSEEIPARMQAKASADLGRLFAAEIEASPQRIDLGQGKVRMMVGSAPARTSIVERVGWSTLRK